MVEKEKHGNLESASSRCLYLDYCAFIFKLMYFPSQACQCPERRTCESKSNGHVGKKETTVAFIIGWDTIQDVLVGGFKSFFKVQP